VPLTTLVSKRNASCPDAEYAYPATMRPSPEIASAELGNVPPASVPSGVNIVAPTVHTNASVPESPTLSPTTRAPSSEIAHARLSKKRPGRSPRPTMSRYAS
jgi:hypothetical protein